MKRHTIYIMEREIETSVDGKYCDPSCHYFHSCRQPNLGLIFNGKVPVTTPLLRTKACIDAEVKEVGVRLFGTHIQEAITMIKQLFKKKRSNDEK